MSDYSSKIEAQIDNFLLPFDKDLVNLCQELRKNLKTLTQPKFELIGDSTISLNIGYGYTEKAWDCFCAIIVYSKHINISFPSGAALSDPDNLLIGTGKRVRHIKIKTLEDIKSDAIIKLLIEARNTALLNSDKELDVNDEIVTIIKQIKGIKKRPGTQSS